MNQKTEILKHLQTYGHITPMEALDRFSCFRLSARISELREEGYLIKTVMVTRLNKYGNECTFAKYVFIGEEK